MSQENEPWAYGIVRNGKCIASEHTHAVALKWIDAEIVPLVPIYRRDELLEQVECANITEKNMEGRLNIMIVKFAAMKQSRDELIGICQQVIDKGIGVSDISAMKSAIARAKGGEA